MQHMDTRSGQRDWRVYTYLYDIYEKVMRYRRWYKMFSADTSGVVLRVVVGWEIGSLGGGDCIASASVYEGSTTANDPSRSFSRRPE